MAGLQKGGTDDGCVCLESLLIPRALSVVRYQGYQPPLAVHEAFS